MRCRLTLLFSSPAGIAVVLGIVALAFRVIGLATIPPGLHHDEAWNGLDAQTISLAFHPIFFTHSTGREPIFLYVQALSMALFGPTPFALRVVAALFGTITVVLVVALGRAMTGRTAVGAVAGYLAACSFWFVLDSRLGYRLITEPAFETASILALWAAWHGPAGRRRVAPLLLGGVLVGSCFYTYTAARTFPAVLLLWMLWRIAAAPRPQRLREFSGWLLSGVVAIAVAAPLGLYFLHHPDEFFGRAGQVSVFSPTAQAHHSSLFRSAIRTLGMFSVQGDPLWKENLGGKPVFDPVISAFFSVGVALALVVIVRSVRRRAESGHRPDGSSALLSPESSWLLIWWVLVNLLPGVLSTESPYFPRVIGVIPAIFLFPAVTLVALHDDLARRRAAWGKIVLVVGAVILVGEAASTAIDYFGRWAPSEAAYDGLHAEAATMAQALERLPTGPPVVILTDYYRHPTIRFLAPRQSAQATWLNGPEAWVIPPGSGPALYAVQGGAEPAFLDLSRLFRPSALVATARQPDGHAAYRIYRATPADVALPPPAVPLDLRLGDLVHLRGYTVVPQRPGSPDTIGVLLYWSPLRPSTRRVSIFTHLQDQSGHLWAQKDDIGYFGADWQPGAAVVSYHPITVPAGTPPVEMQLRAGFYHLDDLVSLPAAGVPAAQHAGGLSLGAVAVQPVTTTMQGPQATKPLGESVSVIGVSPLPATVPQGGTIGATVYLRTAGALAAGAHIVLGLHDQAGRALISSDAVPLAAQYPPSRWRPGVVAEHHRVGVGLRASPGTALIVATLVDGHGRPVTGGGTVALGHVTITPLARLFTAPKPAVPLTALVGNDFQLVGYDLATDRITPGGQLTVTLYWRDVRPSDTAYTVFMHLVDQRGTIRGQHDSQPAAGKWPTTAWEAGQYVVDRYRIPIATTAPAGSYQIEFGLYDARTGKRLMVTGPNGRSLGDHLTIAGLHT